MPIELIHVCHAFCSSVMITVIFDTVHPKIPYGRVQTNWDHKVKMIASTRPSCFAFFVFRRQVSEPQTFVSWRMSWGHNPSHNSQMRSKWFVIFPSRTGKGQKASPVSCFRCGDMSCILCGVASKARHAPKCEDEIDFFLKSLSNVKMLFVGWGVRWQQVKSL